MTGLDPDGEDGRDLLRRELLDPAYNQENPVLRLLDWLAEQLDAGLAAAGSTDPLVAVAAMVVLLVLALGAAWLVTRARAGRETPRRSPGVLDDVRATAAELRARAEAALGEGRHEEALLDAFRALAARGVEAGRIPDLPGATAREVAASLAADHRDRGPAARHAADLFDGVRYGGRRVGREQVVEVLRLDDDLAGVR